MLGSDVCVLCSVSLFMIFKIVLSNPANNCDLFKILFLKPQQLLPVIPINCCLTLMKTLTAVCHAHGTVHVVRTFPGCRFGLW